MLATTSGGRVSQNSRVASGRDKLARFREHRIRSTADLIGDGSRCPNRSIQPRIRVLNPAVPSSGIKMSTRVACTDLVQSVTKAFRLPPLLHSSALMFRQHLRALGVQRGDLVHDLLRAAVRDFLAAVRVLHGEVEGRLVDASWRPRSSSWASRRRSFAASTNSARSSSLSGLVLPRLRPGSSW